MTYTQLMKEREAEKTEISVPAEPEPALEVQETPEPQLQSADPVISEEAINSGGYTDASMVPITKEQALELFERDVPVYMLHSDHTEEMAFDAEEIRAFDGIVGISREDWETVKEGLEPVVEKPDYEQAFLIGKEDGFLLLQLKDTPDLAELRFENKEYLQKNGLSAAYENYAAVYSDSLQAEKAQGETLADIYTRFNIDRPEDFTGHSLSVSDIIVLRQQGRVSCHYVDSFGFRELPQFLPENYLKNAEMAMEDDYGMIDGIINNGKSAAATAKELPDDERPSVLEKLRSFNRNEPQEAIKKVAPKRSAEREI